MLSKQEIRFKNKQKLFSDRYNKSYIISQKCVQIINNLSNIEKIGFFYPAFAWEVDITLILNLLERKHLIQKFTKEFVREFGMCKISKHNQKTYQKYKLGDNLQIGKFNILEPIDTNIKEQEFIPQLIFIPGLGFDLKGNRLGSGAGYYDKYLKLLGGDIVKIGVCYSNLIEESITCENHDIKMDYIVTENLVQKYCSTFKIIQT